MPCKFSERAANALNLVAITRPPVAGFCPSIEWVVFGEPEHLQLNGEMYVQKHEVGMLIIFSCRASTEFWHPTALCGFRIMPQNHLFSTLVQVSHL